MLCGVRPGSNGYFMGSADYGKWLTLNKPNFILTQCRTWAKSKLGKVLWYVGKAKLQIQLKMFNSTFVVWFGLVCS